MLQLQKQKPPEISTLKKGWVLLFVCFLSIYLRSVEAPAEVKNVACCFLNPFFPIK